MNTATTTLILSVSNDPLRQACAGFLARYGGPTLDCVALLEAAIKAGAREHVFVVPLGQMALHVGEMYALNTDSVRHNQGWRTIVFRGKGGDTFERVVPVQALRDLDRLIDGCTDTPLIRNTQGDRMDRAAADRLLHP